MCQKSPPALYSHFSDAEGYQKMQRCLLENYKLEEMRYENDDPLPALC